MSTEGLYLQVTPESELEEFFKAVGAAAPEEPLHTYELKKEGDGYVEEIGFAQTYLPGFWFRDYGKLAFEPGQEVKHKDLSGSDSSSVYTVEENKVTQVQKIGVGGPVEVKIERLFEEDKLITILSSPSTNKTARIEFKKIQ